MKNNEHGFAIKGLVVLILLLCILVSIIYYTFGRVVPPGYIGIRQVTVDIPLGPRQGFSERGLRPGYHWTIPFYSTIHLVPQTLQLINFHRSEKSKPSSIEEGVLEVKTNDGPAVDMDISVVVRYFSFRSTAENDKHGGPGDLLINIGVNPAAWENQIRRVAANELRIALGNLLAGQFYDPSLRQDAIDSALRRMNEQLSVFGIRVEDLLLRRYTYQDSRIDDAIFNKNFQSQEERFKEASSRLASERAKIEQEIATWDANIKTMEVEGENQSNVIRSQADLYEKQKKAEGDLVLAKSQAESDRLKAEALSQGDGSEVYVAKQIAPLISGLKGGVITNIDPYDLDEWSKRLGVSTGGAGK